MSSKKLFNDGWSFTKREIGESLDSIHDPAVEWQLVDIPHDWLIYNTNDLYETGEGWYRKTFIIEELQNHVISLYFEGVYMNSTVFINDKVAGEWKYGYSSFEFDITKYLKVGENEIKVRVVHQSPNSRWYSGAGIYRNVWMKITAETHFVTDGIYITTRKEDSSWKVELDAETITKAAKSMNAVIQHTILGEDDRVVAKSANTLDIGNVITLDKQVVEVTDPILWSLEKPYLYTLRSELLLDGAIVDEVTQSFGFRILRFDSEKGFFINDSNMKLHGANHHHDLGSLGAAVNKVALERQLTILKDMGVNAIRTSHNMPATELMELADRMGMLIVSEAFDIWELSKTEYDYSRFFPDWHERDVASWIRRDRNHPSVIMWSIGNEIYDTHASERGVEITKKLKELVYLHDPRHNALVTIGSNYMAWEGAQKCADEIDCVGYNYAEYLYEKHHSNHPDWVIYGSETSATIQSRGVYHFPADVSTITHDDEQCSSLGNCTTRWGAKSTQHAIIDDRDTKFCLGQFIWSGFDYIGEPTPYTTKNSYFGQIDTAGFPKDTYYLYQAEWTDYKVKPMVHILPYWDFNEGQLIDIRIYSNAPKTELFFNEKSMGVFEIDHKKGKQLSGTWQLEYHPGTIKAVAYDENDNVIAVDTRTSFQDAAKIVIKPDKTTLYANGLDLIFVELSMEDKNGNMVWNANNRVEVEVSGAGRLVGLDNGDSTDYDQYKGTSRKLFQGKLLAIIAAKLEPGDIHITVSSMGLPTETMILKALPCDRIPGVTALAENVKSEYVDEIPIRKIELSRQGNRYLGKEYNTVLITAKIYPENATYQDLIWQVFTPGGIETNIAKIEAASREAKVTALGDGSFRVRCSAKNGKKSPEVISELEFEVTGLGITRSNPYELVHAGLYNATNTDLGAGLFGGVVTGDGETYFAISNLDFGDFGSDEITIPIFSFENDPIPVEIWEGIPGETDSELLLRGSYQAKSIYNTYQSNTFRLTRRVKGVTTISLAFDQKLTVQGFWFTKQDKAYAKLLAKENDGIYGDHFIIMENAIEQIGNNVNIEFMNMDFGTEGFSKLIICGKSNIKSNTIHIRFYGDDGDVNQIAEFPHSEEYVEKEYILNSVTGNQRVSFMFMPGSNFDFKWFQFIK